MKKSLLAVVPMACMSLSNATDAQPQGAQNSNTQNKGSRFDGVYVGAAAGIINSFANVDHTTRANFSTTISYLSPGDGSSYNQVLSSESKNRANRNFAAGAFSIGIGKVTRKKVYVGGELVVNLGQKKAAVVEKASTSVGGTSIPSQNTGTLKTTNFAKLNTNELALDGKLGTVLRPDMLIYARFGAAFNKLRLYSNNKLEINDTILPAQKTSYLNTYGQKSLVGFRFGLGSEQFLTKHLAAKIDYVYTWYGKAYTNGSGNITNTFPSFPTTINGFTNSASAKMDTQTVMVGLSYYFHDKMQT